MMYESKSIDFQVTYIERKQESFYKPRESITNTLMRSANITTDQQMKSTKFINQKSV